MSTVTFDVNGSSVRADRSARRLSDVLRDDLGFTATKVGCDAGDCGACTVLLDGEPVSACMTPVGRLEGRRVDTLEGLDASGETGGLQARVPARTAPRSAASARRACWSSAAALLRVTPAPTEQQVMDALGGVLCRCTGYRKIVAAVMNARAAEVVEPAAPGRQGRRTARAPRRRRAQGGRHRRLRRRRTLPTGRSPSGSCVRRTTGPTSGSATWTAYRRRVAGSGCGPDRRRHPGPQPIRRDPRHGRSAGVRRTDEQVRFRGEAVAMVVGEPEPMAALDLSTFPVTWDELPPLMSVDDARRSTRRRLHDAREGNVLVRGIVRRGDLDEAFAAAEVDVEGVVRDRLPRARLHRARGGVRRARRRPGRGAGDDAVAAHGPVELEAILGLPDGAVRIKPTAVGGGFGSKLDLSVQPYLALAAWKLGRPVRLTYTRPESMMSTTKRHPSRLHVRIGADARRTPDRDGLHGRVRHRARTRRGDRRSRTACRCTPAGPTSTTPTARGPSPCTRTGRRRAPSAGSACRSRRSPRSACSTSSPTRSGSTGSSSGYRNALTAGVPTVTGQVFASGVGYRECLEALRPHRERALAEAARANAARSLDRAAASAWPACGTAAGTPRCRTPRRSRSGCGATGASRCSRERSTWARAPTP